MRVEKKIDVGSRLNNKKNKVFCLRFTEVFERKVPTYEMRGRNNNELWVTVYSEKQVEEFLKTFVFDLIVINQFFDKERECNFVEREYPNYIGKLWRICGSFL